MRLTETPAPRAELRGLYEAEGAVTERYESESFWDSRYHLQRKAAIDEMLRTLVAPGDAFLDVGCGTGEYLESAREMGATGVVGADLALSYLDRLNADGGQRSLVQADAGSLPFADGSFDVVLCSEVIEHIPDRAAEAVVCELARVARRAVCITTPNRDALIRRFARRLVPGRVDELDADVGHINLLDREDLTALVGATGFRVTAFETRHITPPVLGEVMHLPALLAPVIMRLEHLANRCAGRAGNTMFIVIEAQRFAAAAETGVDGCATC